MRRLLPFPVAIAALALAPGALAAQSPHAFTATVVARAGAGVLVAHPNGTVSLVQSAHARVGDRVAVSSGGLRVLGLSRVARIRGIVVAHRSGGFVLAAAGRLIVVQGAGRRLSSAADNGGPQVGDVVGVVVSIDAQGNITATSTQDDGPAGTSTVQATVTAVGTNTITLDVNGNPVTLQLPTAPTALPAVGASVNLTITFANGEATASEDDQGSGGQSGEDGQGGQQQSGGDDGVGSYGSTTVTGAGSSSQAGGSSDDGGGQSGGGQNGGDGGSGGGDD